MCLDDTELERSLKTLKAGHALPEAQIVRYVAASTTCHEPKKRYTLLHIAGLSGDRRFREALETSLYDKTDPMLTRIALLSLCRYWGEAERYRDVLTALVGLW